MQTYKFNTRVSEKGIITLPYTPDLMGQEVELIILPKDTMPRKITKEELAFRVQKSEDEIASGQTLSQEELEKDSLLW